MKTIITTYKKLDKQAIEDLKAQKPQIQHISTLIEDECFIFSNGKLIAAYMKADFETTNLLEACNDLKFSGYKRTRDLITYSVNINSLPRNPLKENLCRPALLRYDNPKKHDVFLSYARLMSKQYRKHFIEAFVEQIKSNYIGKTKVNEYYRITGTPFSGGVVNKNSAINYHYDYANTKNGISCMVILKENVAGGELILPELDIGFACQDGYILLFDGQKYLHGVTDIIAADNGYRYTIVYYNNKGMHLCLPPEKEIEHYQNWLDRNEK